MQFHSHSYIPKSFWLRSKLMCSSHARLSFLVFLFTYVKGRYNVYEVVALCCKVEASPLLASPFRLPEINA